MPAFEYSVPATLVTPGGTVTFNQGDGLVLDDIREERPISRIVRRRAQADGAFVRPGFRGESIVTLVGHNEAIGGSFFADRRSIVDDLDGKCRTLLRPTLTELVSSCRLRWQPSGYGDERMYDKVRVYQELPTWQPHPQSAAYKQFTLTLVCPFPYAIDLTQDSTAITAGGTSTVPNDGNTEVWPVVKVYGSSFTLENVDTGEQVIATGIVGMSPGDYVELDFYEETAYINGNGASAMQWIDETSLFFSIAAGGQDVTCNVATTVLSNNAWA